MYHSFQSGASPFVTFFYIPALRKKADGFRSVQTTETISLKAVQTYALELPPPLAFMTALCRKHISTDFHRGLRPGNHLAV